MGRGCDRDGHEEDRTIPAWSAFPPAARHSRDGRPGAEGNSPAKSRTRAPRWRSCAADNGIINERVSSKRALLRRCQREELELVGREASGFHKSSRGIDIRRGRVEFLIGIM